MATLSIRPNYHGQTSAGESKGYNEADIADEEMPQIPIVRIKHGVPKAKGNRRLHTVAEFNHVRGNTNNYNHYRLENTEDDVLPPIDLFGQADDSPPRPYTAPDLGHYPYLMVEEQNRNIECYMQGNLRTSIYKLDGDKLLRPNLDKNGVIYIDGSTIDEARSQKRHLAYEKLTPRLAVGRISRNSSPRRSWSPRKLVHNQEDSRYMPRPGDLFQSIFEEDDRQNGHLNSPNKSNRQLELKTKNGIDHYTSPRRTETYVVTNKNSILLPDGPALLTEENMLMHGGDSKKVKSKKDPDDRLLDWLLERQLETMHQADAGQRNSIGNIEEIPEASSDLEVEDANT